MSFNHYDFDINPPHSSSTSGRGVQASSENKCPCCDSPSWCFILDNGNAVLCERTDVAPDGWKRTGTAKDGRPIYAKGSSRQSDRRYKGILPDPLDLRLEVYPKSDFPQWVEIGRDSRGIKELMIEFIYPDAQTGEAVGKVVRKQREDRQAVYDGKTKHIRPEHWAQPAYPGMKDGWWSDRGKGTKTWSLYREAEARDALASGECNVLIYGAGEQAVEAFRHLGLFSICAQGGEGTGDAQIINFLKRNTPQVFVIPPDNDEPGLKAGVKLQASCDRAKIPAVTINLKNIWALLPPKGDITNILNESGMSESEIIKRLEAEIRRAIFSRQELDRKASDPDERFKLELQAILAEADPLKKIRRRHDLSIHLGYNKSEIEEGLNELKQRTSTPKTQTYGLADFFDLESEGLRWLIPGLLPLGETVILAGAPKAGKSVLAIDAAFAVATGESAFLKERVTPGRVLIISVDESAQSTKAKLLKRGFRRKDAKNVEVMIGFDMSQLKTLEDRLETFKPSLVIIDNLKRIYHGRDISENSAEFADDIYTLKELLTRYGASGLLLHHTNKNDDALGVNKIRGSSAITGATWGVWLLEAIPKPDPNNKKKLIVDPKDPKRILSVFARDAEGQQLRIELDLENHSWDNLGGVGDSEEWEQDRKTLEQRIIAILTKNNHLPGLSGREIIELLGMSAEEGRGVYTVLSRMVGNRIITCRPAPGDKRCNIYSLPNQSPPDNSPEPPDSPPPPPPEPPDNDSGNTASNANSDPWAEPEDLHNPPPPPPCVSNVEYSAETHTEQEFQLLNNYSTNYSTITQQPEVVNTPVDYSNPDAVGVLEILNNPESKVGGGCVETESEPTFQPHQLTTPATAPAEAIAPAHPQRQKPAVATESVALTEFKVGDTVGHSDQYMAAYTYHGTVEKVVEDDILVRWVERQGKPNECEKYCACELRRLE